MGAFTTAAEAAADLFAKYVLSPGDARSENANDWASDLGPTSISNELEYEIQAANDTFETYAEIRAAYMAATLGMFIEGYYTGSVPDVDIPLSLVTRRDSLGTMEDEGTLLPYGFYEEDARSAALYLLDRCRRGPEPRPGLFLALLG